uniref:Integrase catalytic domain-containing protein n=1 Tax=Chromera velia CCMP2878 TaxID=1169474 RepID=A0A0K6S5V8_9ALVE|eukprot:Cvel_147.t2-p1 / transcript=Cvel_147.t2 / gene=Cvel_147 / organism=Chromera_velia_CCMP2878 / gene_product=hypothetical protein / transcript_product=hypothetical protein / location=Cvel_scaffold10:8028-10717(+) / protein_length=580 / sequence_SO=supercontig / SO=protein_coding / is_pseudo=false
MYIDFTRLNKITVHDKFPIPHPEELLSRLHGAKFFSSLDLWQYFYQTRIKEGDEEKTAFIISRTPEEHIEHINQVLSLLREHQLYVKVFKCAWLQTEAKFLGLVVDEKGARPSHEKMQGLIEFAQPTDHTSLRQFLGLANWFRRFVPRFSFLAGPLTFLLQGNVPFEWKTAQSRAFAELKKAVQEHATLALPDPSKPVILVPDASQSAGAIGAVALQKDCATGRYRPFAFGSRRLTSTEAKYPVRELEFLAIVHFAKPLSVPLRPWESTCIDRLTDLPPSGDEGFDAILVVTVLCRLIKAVVLIPTHSTAGAEETARIYYQHVSCKKGFQRHIACDRDPRFVARFWQTLYASSSSEVNFATALHHDIAGAVERMNRTLEEALRCLVDMKHSRWSEFLCDIEFVYNFSVYEGTGFASLTLNGGKSLLIPLTLNLPVSVEPSFDVRQFLEEHSQMIAAARDSLRSAQQVITRNVNRRRRPAENIRVGDYVLVHRMWWPRPVGKGELYARKLDSVWFGPFEVETVLPQDNLEVVLPAESRKHPIIHISLCKPYHQPSGKTRPPSVRMLAWAEEEYEVEKILAV